VSGGTALLTSLAQTGSSFFAPFLQIKSETHHKGLNKEESHILEMSSLHKKKGMKAHEQFI
jgi:hypothetical protein